jgi:hypothetical protein
MSSASNSSYPVIGDESIMAPKSHGTTDAPVQSDLRSKLWYKHIFINNLSTDGTVTHKLLIISAALIAIMPSTLVILKKQIFYKKLLKVGTMVQLLFMIQ